VGAAVLLLCPCRLTCVASVSCQAAAAYWRGDQSRESLQRVYGISYPNDTLLKVRGAAFLESPGRSDVCFTATDI
jgi:threonyl-tRNA synthetase